MCTQVIISNLILLCFSVCSVFWDLYCAAPERRDTCEHSSEAKAFHDYVSNKFLILAIITGLDGSNFLVSKASAQPTGSGLYFLLASLPILLPTSLPAACLPVPSSPMFEVGGQYSSLCSYVRDADTYLEKEMVFEGSESCGLWLAVSWEGTEPGWFKKSDHNQKDRKEM